MQIVVISDTHRNGRPLRQIVERHANAELFLHLGDGVDEFERLAQAYPEKRMLSVTGNCDMIADRRESATVSCGIAKIFYTHGHCYNVKHSLDQLLCAAMEQEANVVLYGHTHMAMTEYRMGIHLMNPGSLCEPRGGKASYGVIDVTDKEIVCRIVSLQPTIRW